MKKLVLLIALIPSIAHSQCIIDEKSATYKEVPAYRLQGRVAQAYIRNGNYIIEYSTDLKKFPQILKDHILAHECAHHRLKHTALPKAYDSDSFEFEADCDAVKQLSWNYEQVENLTTIWYSIYAKEYIDTRGGALKKCLHQN
jgi:hypothetical protein